MCQRTSQGNYYEIGLQCSVSTLATAVRPFTCETMYTTYNMVGAYRFQTQRNPTSNRGCKQYNLKLSMPLSKKYNLDLVTQTNVTSNKL